MRSFKQHISENILDKLAIQIQKLSHKITINPNEAYLALTQTQKVEVLKQPRLIFDRKNNELSQIQKQKLINLALQENKLKKQKNIFKIKYHKNQDDRKRILGGGACCSSQRPIEGELKIQKIEPKDGQNRPINKDFERIYNSKVINKKYTSEIVQKEVQYQETKDLFEKCLNRFRKEVIVNINSYRTHIVDIFNLCLLYIISGAQTIDRDDQNEIITKTNVFLDQIRQNIKLFACLDVEFIYSFFADLNDDNLDSAQINQLQQVILFAKKQIEEKIEANEKKELISGVQELAFNKSDQLQYVWQIIDRAREKVKAFTKYNIICQISALLAQKYEKFGQFHDISPYDEMIFYVEKCIEFTQKQSSSYFILYILVQINYLLEKIIQNGKLADITILMRDKLTADLVFQQFMKMLKQQSTQQQQSESFFQFFKFTVKDITYRFLSDAILLKLYSILQFEKISEVDQLWTHLVYTYTTEKNESVKLVFQNNDVFVRRVNQDLETNSTEIGESVVNYQEKRKQVLRANKINNDEIDQLEDTIKDQNDFVDKVNVRLIEKWELEARQRSERDNLQKDNIIQEDYDLYVDQNLSYICGNQIFNQIYSKGSAVDQIITQFLIPNQNDENRGSFRDNFECKVLVILADGGTGKSMLVKKLETILMKEKDQSAKKYKQEINFMPFLVRCNKLDLKNPSLESYLLAQNLSKQQIDKLKSLSKNKVIFLDGYDEYTGDYFRICSQLQLQEWKNTIVIVTSRLEKINENDARTYFSHDNENGVIDEQSFSIVKLKEFETKDIKQYCTKFFNKEKAKNQISFTQEEFLNIINSCLQNKLIEGLLRLPINLYLFTIMTIGKTQSEINELIKGISDQISLLEVFYGEQFNREAVDFMKQISSDLSDKSLKNEIVSSYFNYFQIISIQMFGNKGIISNFTQLKKDEIQFQLQQQIKNMISPEDQIKLQDKIGNYVNSEIITKVKEGESQNYFEVVEFKHKSLFEYFAARAMKYDFDIHGENICNLSISELQKFSINKKLIMNIGRNQSEQQILLKLHKLLEPELLSQSFKQNYAAEDINKTNRYIQYIKKSTISNPSEVSKIDIGSSNLLSALFVSKFSYPSLTFKKCSFSKAYIPYKKSSQLSFEECNLSEAFLQNQGFSSFENSNTRNALLDSFQNIFDSTDVFDFRKVVYFQNKLISITKTGCINCYVFNNDGTHQLKLSKKITSSCLNTLDIITNRLIVSAVQSLFLINPDNFEVEATYKFPSQIETISIYNDKCAVLLKNSFKYVGNLQTGFKKLDIQGQGAILFKEQLITYHQGQLEIYDIKQNSILINSIQSQEFTRGVIDKQGKYLVTIQDKQICLWNFEQLKLIQDMNEHTGQINHASISPDGRFFATASDDQICFLFQLESNKLSLICTINDHQYSMSTANFSQDSQLLITASYKNVCKIRKIDKDSQSPQVIHSVQGEISSIQSLSYSKNGNNLATISQDGNINIWSYEKGYQQVKQLSTNCANSNTIIISKDDKYLISHSNTGVCKVWNIKKDYELLKTIEIEKGIKFIALSQDSKYLAIGCNDKSLQILNVQSSFKLEKALQLEDKKNKEEFGIFIPVADFLAPDKAVDNEEDDGYCVQSAAFSPDGNYLVVGVKNQGIKIFDINNDFKELLSLESGNCVCFSESGKYLASSSNDATFKIWNVQNNFVMIKNIKEHAKQIKSLAFSPNNKYLATGLDDNTCKIWNIEKNFQLINSISSHTLSFKAVAFSSDSKHLATSFEDCTFKVWNLENGSELIQNKQGHSDKIFSIIVSNNGRYLITSSLDKTIKIWDIQNDFKLVNSIQQSLNEMLSVALTPDDKFLISGLSDGQINVWNVNENFELYLTLQLHLNRIISLQTTQKYLLSYSSNEGCKLWDFNQKFDFLGSSQDRAVGAACIKLSPDGRYLATSNKSNQGSNVTIWDVEDNFQAVKTIQDHTEFVSVVNFSPQNKYLITGSNDTTCKIWNINSNFKLVQTIKDHTDKIILASFSLDNKYLVTSSESSCKIWNVERNFQLIKNIQEGFLSAAFTGDGQYLVLGNLDSRCQVLKIEKQKGLISKLTGNNEDAEEINKLEDVFYLEKEL
ncbi:hypothetical protein ABPG73_011475 [Tetrahymena malaccensis]